MSYIDRLTACPCLNLRKASRIVTAMYNEVLAPSGVLITQLPVLGALRVDGPLPLTRLAEVLGLDRTTLSRNLKPMFGLGFVSEIKSEDKRNRLLAISDKGTAALQTALPLWDRAQVKVKEALGKDRLDMLISTLGELERSSS